MRNEASQTDATTDLLTRIAGGDQAALLAFYETFHARVYAFALKRLNNAADAADVLNEVMLEVWRRAAGFEGRSKASTWVLGIAHHKVIDILRRRRTNLVDDDIDDVPSDDANAMETLAGANDATMVRRCLELLSDAHRLVVHLAFFDDLSYPEIAEIANCPLGTVKTRMHHAKRQLKRCLAGTPLNLMAGSGDPDVHTQDRTRS